MELRELGSTGIDISPLGLGTVKFGRDQQVKYPTSFKIPDDKAVLNLLAQAQELGINMLDTAPAYGRSQQRLGQLLGVTRKDWVIVSKVGERFENGASSFDFSYQATIDEVHHSLKTLKTDYIDCVLIHSDGDDLAIFEQGGAVEALVELKQQGLIRSHGMSSKTVAGGLRVVKEMDIVMASCNLEYNDELEVLQSASDNHKGVLIKKGLMSGHVAGEHTVYESMKHVFSQPGVSAMIVGTINPQHLADNVRLLDQAMDAI